MSPFRNTALPRCLGLFILSVLSCVPRSAYAGPLESFFEMPGPLSAVVAELDEPHTVRYKELKNLNGKTIRSIDIQVGEIFDRSDINWLYRTANSLKANTRREVVRRELLFKEGDTFDAFLIHESERVLRMQRYLRRVEIVPIADGDAVDIKVLVQDTWTLIPQINYSSGTGNQRKSAGIVEANLAGLGKRAEVLYQEDDARQTWEGVWEDPRVWGSDYRFLGAYFDRNDGQRSIFSFGKPFRSLIDRRGWAFNLDNGNIVGRLFENGEESYIYRHKIGEFASRYTVASGNPERDLRRYSLGLDYIEHRFYQADAQDYRDLGLDPAQVANDPAGVPAHRRFVGPAFSFEHLIPRYVPKNYIDRFDRVEDYDLGRSYSFNLLFAPEVIGSSENAFLFSGSHAASYQFDENSFVRGEIGLASRYGSGGFADTIARFESKYYNVLGPKYLKQLFVGRHTIAADFFVDYGHDLDKDRQFLVGGDNVVRGYKSRAFAGDKRFGFNLEDRVHFVDDVFQLISVGAAAFVDVGGATYDSFGKLIGNDTYSDVGVGVRFAFPRSSNGSTLRVDFAFPLRDGPDGSAAFEVRIIFAGGQLFDSHLRSENLGAEKANVAIGLDR